MQCPRCGVSNGNRAYVCKACCCPLKTQHPPCKRRRDTADVIELVYGDVTPSTKRVFSIRLRKAGPDYRTFVTADSAVYGNVMQKLVQWYRKADLGLVQA